MFNELEEFAVPCSASLVCSYAACPLHLRSRGVVIDANKCSDQTAGETTGSSYQKIASPVVCRQPSQDRKKEGNPVVPPVARVFCLHTARISNMRHCLNGKAPARAGIQGSDPRIVRPTPECRTFLNQMHLICNNLQHYDHSLSSNPGTCGNKASRTSTRCDNIATKTTLLHSENWDFKRSLYLSFKIYLLFVFFKNPITSSLKVGASSKVTLYFCPSADSGKSASKPDVERLWSSKELDVLGSVLNWELSES